MRDFSTSKLSWVIDGDMIKNQGIYHIFRWLDNFNWKWFASV